MSIFSYSKSIHFSWKLQAVYFIVVATAIKCALVYNFSFRENGVEAALSDAVLHKVF